MDMTTETKSAAAKFLETHDAVVNELASANITLDDQRKEIEKQDITITMQRDAISQANAERDRYLQYSCELSAQLQFIVAGSARALMIGAAVRNAIASKANDIPAVPGADIKELENIIDRIGDINAAAKDGNGLTNADELQKSRGLNPSGIPASAGVMVDKDGQPITPSVASQSLQVA